MRVWLNPIRMTALGITASDVVEGDPGAEHPGRGGPDRHAASDRPASSSSSPCWRPASLRTSSNSRTSSCGPTRMAGVVRIRDIGQVQLAAQSYTNSASPRCGALGDACGLPGAGRQCAGGGQRRRAADAHARRPSFRRASNTRSSTTRRNSSPPISSRSCARSPSPSPWWWAWCYVFLQDWRATLIPTIAIPVSLIGVFAVLYLLGYSANTVDLFAIVLAITLVVDDAIVVVENVSRHLEEHPERSLAETTERGDAGDHRPGGRDHARAGGGVRAGRLHRRRHRRALPAVRRDDLGLDRDLGDQRADAEPCALRAHSAPAAEAAVRGLSLVQPRLPVGPQHLRPHRALLLAPPGAGGRGHSS